MQKDVFIQETISAHNGWTILGVSTEALLNGVNSSDIDVIRKINFSVGVDNGLQLLDKVELGKRSLSVNHFI